MFVQQCKFFAKAMQKNVFAYELKKQQNLAEINLRKK